ncbi:MAG: polymerase subunit gamma and tau [Clostridiales bacterium]|jgi:DNA polymerase-3 subunit gamma/tau|nr:polymerase subunit gamma and tau [Clostridiales bacterium]
MVFVMSYKALYRLWRPQAFGEIIGQKHITKTLKNALENNKIAHAYLLSGPRGTGKTSTAKIIAKTINCRSPESGEACNKCSNCTLINSGNSMDVIEIDGASNRGIDEIRELRDKINLAPAEGKYKVYIIDEVHMLTGEAFNALLKTLEEPPGHVIFIMATTEPHKIPATVLSRCQRFDFKRLSNEEMVSRMEEICNNQNVQYESDALYTIARFAGGGMRDALSILDQCLSYCSDSLKLEDVQQVIGIVDYTFLKDVLVAIIEKDIKKVLIKIGELVSSGKDINQFTLQLLDYMRNLLLLKICGSSELLQVPQGEIETLQKQADKLSQSQITDMIDILVSAQKEMKWSSDSRLLLETALVKATRSTENNIDSLLKRISYLEKIIKDENITVEEGNNRHVKEEAKNEEEVSVVLETDKLSIEAVKSRWEEFMATVKKNKITTYAFLVEAQPVDLQNGSLILEFKESHAFHMDKLQQKENKEIVVTTFKEVFGENIDLKIQMENKNVNQTTFGSYDSNDNKKEEENRVVEEAVKLFGGNVVEIID